MRLLVVEDDAKLARALTRGLEREGYAIDVADTGDDAVRQALAGGYDGVVLDVMLPGPDGFAVCRELRRRDLQVPVLMLTARADVSDRIRGLDAGADDYLVKPFDFGELLARNAGQVVSRKELLEQVWEEQYDGSQNVVDVYVGYVRKKLEVPPDGRRIIRTVRGVGFVLEAD